MPNDPPMCLASMGNYVFRTADLVRELNDDAKVEESKHDFGHDILPRMVENGQAVYAYDFGRDERGSWRGVEARPRLLARRGDHRGLLAGRRWTSSRFTRNSTCTTRAGRSERGSPTTSWPGEVRVPRRKAHARVGIATDSMVSHGCIISGGRHSPKRAFGGLPHQLVQRSRRERALRESAHRSATLQPPAVHHRQGRGNSRRPGDWLRSRGGQEAFLRHGERARRHPGNVRESTSSAKRASG